MITVYFPEPDAILSFEGDVLDVFYPQAYCRRVHVHHVTDIHVDVGRQGKRFLEIKTPLTNPVPSLPFDPELDEKVNDLVARVQQARAAVKLV